jgi:hypothetical protein
MSDFPQDAGDGALFKNREKSKPSQPDYFGKAEIEGRSYRVSAWVKDSKKNPGQKYMSLSFRLDEQQRPTAEQRAAAGPTFRDDEQIPFAPEAR